MGFFDKLFGHDEPQPQSQNQVTQQTWPQTPGQAPNASYIGTQPFGSSPINAQAPQQISDDQALARYRYMLQTAPPEALEQAHEEAFAQLTPEQRQMVLQQLAQNTPDNERSQLTDDPRSLARAATRVQIRQPGVLERLFGHSGMGGNYGNNYGNQAGGMGGFGGGGMGGMGGGMGMGGMLAGSLLTSIAGGFVGSAIANQFFNHSAFAENYAQSDFAQQANDTNFAPNDTSNYDAGNYDASQNAAIDDNGGLTSNDDPYGDPGAAVDPYGDPGAAVDPYGDPGAGDFSGASGDASGDFGGDFGGGDSGGDFGGGDF